MSLPINEQVARGLLDIGAVFLRPDEPFTWASGIKSPIYCDNRLTLSSPEARTLIEQGLADLIYQLYPEAEALMGTATAGIAHAAIVGHITGLPLGYVRGSAKDHGRPNQIAGQLAERFFHGHDRAHPPRLALVRCGNRAIRRHHDRQDQDDNDKAQQQLNEGHALTGAGCSD